MIFFEINDLQMIDLEKIESVEISGLDESIEVLCVIGPNRYLIDKDKHKEFFENLKHIERGDSLSKQYVSV